MSLLKRSFSYLLILVIFHLEFGASKCLNLLFSPTKPLDDIFIRGILYKSNDDALQEVAKLSQNSLFHSHISEQGTLSFIHDENHMVIHDWKEFNHIREYRKYYLRIDDNVTADELPTIIEAILKWKSAEQIKIVDVREFGDFDSKVVESILELPKLKSYDLYTTRFLDSYVKELRPNII